MYWTLELASKLEDAPWPATKEELIDFCLRSGAPAEVIENLIQAYPNYLSLEMLQTKELDIIQTLWENKLIMTKTNIWISI